MNLGATLLDFDTDRGGQQALITGDRSVTFVELRTRALSAAAALEGLGIGSGDRVAIWSWNRIEYVEALLGCFLAGIAVVPVNRRLHPAEVDTLLAASGSRALIHDAEPAELDALPSAAGLVRIPIAAPGAGGWNALLAGSAPMITAESVAGDHPAWIFYSSGTSGMPKGAVHTHASVVSGLVTAQAAGIGFRSSDRLILVSPLSHGSGFMAMLALMAGACQIVYDSPSFDGARVVETMKAHAVNGVTYLVPTQLERLVEAVAGDAEPPALRIVVYGSAPSSLEVLHRTVEVLGSALIQIYGQAEAPPVVSLLDGPSHVAFAATDDPRLQSAGRFAPGVEVRLAPVGEGADGAGEIQLRTTFSAARYLGTAAPDFPVTEDGWLRTGDVGRIAGDGYLFIVDRVRDIVVTGGTNVYAAEVERALSAHPAVREVAVIGVPDARWGERVHAVIVPAGERPDPVDLSDFVGARLARFKVPKTYGFINDLPRNSAGKVLKRVLREMVGEG